MKANELRIGNYLKSDGVVVKIDGRSIFDIWGSEASSCKYEPIPLTEEWILKFGFIANENGEPQIETNDGMGLSISIQETPYKYSAWHFISSEHTYSIISECKFVHQLQNLYFALTGKELELSQPSEKCKCQFPLIRSGEYCGNCENDLE